MKWRIKSLRKALSLFYLRVWRAIRAFLQEIYDASSVDAVDTEYYDFVTRDKR